MASASSRSGRLGRTVEHTQDVVKRIALRRRFSCRANQVEDVVEAQTLCGVRAGFVIDLLAYHGSLEVIHAKGERGLREERRHHDPMCLDVLEVVEEEPANGKVAQIVEPGGRSSLAPELDP